jgi:hypothetical protein
MQRDEVSGPLSGTLGQVARALGDSASRSCRLRCRSADRGPAHVAALPLFSDWWWHFVLGQIAPRRNGEG